MSITDMDHHAMNVEIQRLRAVLMERHRVEKVTKLALWVALVFAASNFLGVILPYFGVRL